MNAVIITQQNYDELISRLERIQQEVSKIQFEPKDPILDNAQVCQILGLSKRSLQEYRNSGLISYSQIGAKIYYRLSEINRLLDKHYKPAFKK
jgi:Helix-turn-helix domain